MIIEIPRPGGEPHLLYHGDAIGIVNSITAPIGLVLTDPPYGAGFASRPLKYQRAAGQKPEAWDSKPISQPFMDHLCAMGSSAIVWGGNYYAMRPTRGFLVWSKAGNAPSMADCEFAWTNIDMNARVFEKSVKSASLEKDLHRGAHPTQKPVELMRWSMMFAPNGTVLDPFMGSGTTGVACVREGRRFIGIERDARFVGMAFDRITAAMKSPRLAIENPPAKPVQDAMII